LGPPGVYGDDRILAAGGEVGGPILEWLGRAGHPIERIEPSGRATLGADMFLWEFATAVAGAVLGINPFDQPDVQSAKAAANRPRTTYRSRGSRSRSRSSWPPRRREISRRSGTEAAPSHASRSGSSRRRRHAGPALDDRIRLARRRRELGAQRVARRVLRPRD